MKLERFLHHIAVRDFRAASACLADELPRNRITLLRKTRAELAKLIGQSKILEEGYARGYMQAMADMIFSYEITIIEAKRKK